MLYMLKGVQIIVKKTIKERIGDGVNYVKTRWDTPAPGEVTNLKEFLSYCFGTMGICGFSFVCNQVSFASGYFCGSIMEIKLIDFTIITFIALIVKYVTLYVESISMTIFENLGHLAKNKAKTAAIAYTACIVVGIGFYFIPSAPFDFIIKGLPQIVANILVITGAGGLVNWFLRAKLCRKYGRYKPFMMIYGIPITILSVIITFVPTTLEYTYKLVILHFLCTLRSRFTALYQDNPQNIIALITPNSVERQKYYSIGGIFLGFFRSIFAIIFPVMIVVTGGYLDIRSYRVFIPVLSIASLLMGLTFAKVKERVAEHREDTPKIDFKKSAKTLLTNKYFWIINIAATISLWNEVANGVINYILIYDLRIEWIMGFVGIIGITSVVGNVLTPMLTKKFEKRTLIVTMNAVLASITACYIVAIKLNSVVMLLFFIFIRSALAASCAGIVRGLNADALDYHQWKTGERADNMVSVFTWFTTPVGTILGLVSPWLLKMFGYTSDWDVLYDSTIFTNIILVYVVLTVVGLIISTVPYSFYDLTRAKHEQCVKEIYEREEAHSDEETAAAEVTV